VEESKRLDASPEPAIIIAASGMCEGGRVVHHLRATIEDDRNMIIVVGFQASHTLGRRIVERRAQVRVFGVMRDLRAEVVVLDGLSAHADQGGLLRFATALRAHGPLETVHLVHGEPAAEEALAALLRDHGFPNVRIPMPGERLVA